MLFSSASPIILRPTLQATSVDRAQCCQRSGLATPAGLVFEGVQAKAFYRLRLKTDVIVFYLGNLGLSMKTSLLPETKA